jgi:hypothetical protein
MGGADLFPTTMEEGREGRGGGGRWKTEYLRPGWCGRRRRSQPPSQRPRWAGPASSWRRSWRETARPTRAGSEVPGVEGAPAEAREGATEGGAAKKTVERWWGEGPRHPQTAQATCGWCQSTGCRRMATENHPESYLGRRRATMSTLSTAPPRASRLPKSSRVR